MVDFARVQKELHECNKDIEVSGISIKLKEDNNNSLTHLTGTIPGPLATPYEGGNFNIDIVLPGKDTASHLYVHMYIRIVDCLLLLFPLESQPFVVIGCLCYC